MNALLQRWHRRRRLPLRVTLVAAMLALVTVALMVIGVAGSSLLQRYLLDRVDSQLAAIGAASIPRCANGQRRSRSAGRTTSYPGGGLYVSLTDGGGNALIPPAIGPQQ